MSDDEALAVSANLACIFLGDCSVRSDVIRATWVDRLFLNVFNLFAQVQCKPRDVGSLRNVRARQSGKSASPAIASLRNREDP